MDSCNQNQTPRCIQTRLASSESHRKDRVVGPSTMRSPRTLSKHQGYSPWVESPSYPKEEKQQDPQTNLRSVGTNGRTKFAVNSSWELEMLTKYSEDRGTTGATSAYRMNSCRSFAHWRWLSSTFHRWTEKSDRRCPHKFDLMQNQQSPKTLADIYWTEDPVTTTSLTTLNTCWETVGSD